MKKKHISLALVILAVLRLSFNLFYSIEVDISQIDFIKEEESTNEKYAIYTNDGDIVFADEIVSIRKNMRKNIIVKTNKEKIQNPIGIIENPPRKSIMDIKDMTLESLSNDKQILIIYIDGLGYDLYLHALKNNIIPYMASLDKGDKAITTYPPITDVTFASMVTGKTPKYTTIHDREKKTMPVESMFEIADSMGKTSKLIEGDIRILTCDVETILNIDDNKDGFIDDEIYRYTLKEIKKPKDILLVHFHSYDDLAHLYGPYSDRALEQLSVLDNYIQDIVKNYEGDIIITSDHGMHDTGDGRGMHGLFLSEDLFIPIIVKSGK